MLFSVIVKITNNLALNKEQQQNTHTFNQIGNNYKSSVCKPYKISKDWEHKDHLIYFLPHYHQSEDQY